MIELIQDVPGNVVAFSATGKISGDDYEEVLIPAVEAVLKAHGKVRVLGYLGPDFAGFEMAAMWDDAKIGMKHFTSWEKIALVTDVDWIKNSVKVFGFLVHGEVKLFANNEFDAAKAWVAE